jgi:hypothetical protein
MLVEPVVGDGHVAPVPTAPVATLIPAHQQDGVALAVEGEQHPDLASPCRAGPQFLHIRMPAAHHGVRERTAQRRTGITQHANCCQQRLRICVIKFVSPCTAGRVELHRPRHPIIISLLGCRRNSAGMAASVISDEGTHHAEWMPQLRDGERPLSLTLQNPRVASAAGARSRTTIETSHSKSMRHSLATSATRRHARATCGRRARYRTVIALRDIVSHMAVDMGTAAW